MKKRLLAAVLGVMFVLLMPFPAKATDEQTGFTYEITDGYARITGYTALKSFRGTLPEKLGGAAVTAIAPKAFEGNCFLETVAIPQSVTEIGDNAFNGCIYLEEITLNSGLEKIGAYAFADTIAEKLTIPDGVIEIGDYAFDECFSLADISIPASVKEIGEYVFEDTAWLAEAKDKTVVVGDGILIRILGEETKVTIPDNVEVINNGAAEGAVMSELVIPETVREIRDWAFASCGALSSVTFIGEPEYIGGFAFFATPWLIECPDDCITIGKKYYKYTGRTEKAVIPDGIESISPSAFEGCEMLTTVTMPDSVTEIGDNAFYRCTLLKDVKLSASLTKIGERAFYSCQSLEKLTVPSSVRIIGKLAFTCCIKLKSINVPNSVTELGENSLGMTYDDATGVTADADFVIYSDNKLAAEYAESSGVRLMSSAQMTDSESVEDDDMLDTLTVILIALAAMVTAAAVFFIVRALVLRKKSK